MEQFIDDRNVLPGTYHHDYNLRKRKLPTIGEAPLSQQHLSPIAASVDDRAKSYVPRRNANANGNHFLVVLLVSVLSRLWMINSSPLVVWDEAHFGKFASWYIKRKFYFDVHPPLGKMLVAFFGWLHGYDGNFSFDSGKEYESSVPIGAMRAWCALFGALVAPFVYGICRNVDMSKSLALAVALMIVFDNALLSISKFVLLDPILLCFTASSFCAITAFEKENRVRPFSKRWHLFALLTGTSLGCVTSVKWVGLFTFASVGLFTVCQLWEKLPTCRINPKSYFRHWIYRVVYLIVVPVLIYVGTFYVHFVILERSGTGDSHMSSMFQSRLVDSPIKNGPDLIIIGKSTVTIRNQGHGGGLLHSHHHPYPEGSKQTQITLYHHRDDNNKWRVFSPWNWTSPMQDVERPLPYVREDGTIVCTSKEKPCRSLYLQDGDVIRLFHNSTGRNLHSHHISAPINVYENEASGYGNFTFGDAKDLWVVEKVGDAKGDVVKRLTTTFRLRHHELGCYLSGTGARLPEWGFEQMEVACSPLDRRRSSRRALWNIEEHDDGGTTIPVDSEADPDPAETLVRRWNSMAEFLRDFVDLNVAMWYGNNALVPKPGKKDILVSQPSQWPLLDVGLRMCNWNDDTRKYYLLGNPVVWWICAGALVVFPAYAAILAIRSKIVGNISFDDERFIYDGVLWWSAWFLHYIPFYIMGRVTYLHHYFPSLVVSTMVFGHLMTRCDWWKNRKNDRVALVFVALIGATFVYFAPMSYGFIGKAEVMGSRRWRSSWNIV